MQNLTTKDGLKLKLHEWRIDNPKAQVIFIHGFFEHAGRYDSEAQFFNRQGFDFVSYDQRTHGRSDGKPRSYIANFSSYLDDLEQYLHYQSQNNTLPYYILAHSMGGLVLCSYLIEKRPLKIKPKGVILSAPFLATNDNTAPILQKMAGIVGTLLPRLKVLALNADDISSDPTEVKSYLEDPLIYTDKMYAGSGWQMIKQIKAVQHKFEDINLPLLILHGADDNIANIEGSQQLYKDSPSTDKELIVLKEQKHEVLKEIKREATLELIVKWIKDRH